MIRYKCKKCRSQLETWDELQGKKEKCPVCGLENTVKGTQKTNKIENINKNLNNIKSPNEDPKEYLENLSVEEKSEEKEEAIIIDETLDLFEEIESEKVNMKKYNVNKIVPSYIGLRTMAKMYITLGQIFIVIGSLSFVFLTIASTLYRDSMLMIPAIISLLCSLVTGIFLIGFGEFFLCIRDLASNSFFLRKK